MRLNRILGGNYEKNHFDVFDVDHVGGGFHTAELDDGRLGDNIFEFGIGRYRAVSYWLSPGPSFVG